MSRKLAGALCATVALLTAAAPAAAQVMRSEAVPSRTIFVPRDKSLSFRLETPASRIVVAQADLAEIVATTDHTFYVRGKELGSTNLLVYGPGGRLQEVIAPWNRTSPRPCRASGSACRTWAKACCWWATWPTPASPTARS
jgi:pilus assembly protein CpaC